MQNYYVLHVLFPHSKVNSKQFEALKKQIEKTTPPGTLIEFHGSKEK